MKKNLHFISLAAVMMMAACSVACVRSEDLIEKDVPVEENTPKFTMTVNATKDGGTKALSDNGSAITSTWTAGDALEVWTSDGKTTKYGTLIAQSGGSSYVVFSGVLDSNPTNGESLLLKYPSARYTSQNGTLTGNTNSIDKVCDYAEATVTATVAGESVTTTDAIFSSQQALVKFNLLWNAADLYVNSIKFSAASNKLVKRIGAGGQVFYTGAYTITGVSSGPYGSGSQSPDNLLDGNISTKWEAQKSTHTSAPNYEWYIDFNTASTIQVDGYTLYSASDAHDYPQRNPKTWELKAKVNESDDWTQIAYVANDDTFNLDNSTPYHFDVNSPGEYKYFKFIIWTSHDEAGATEMQLGELKLWHNGTEITTTYGDVAVSHTPATNTLYVALRNEKGAADTYTIRASDGTNDYFFQHSGIYFQYGHFYPINLNMWKATTVGTSSFLYCNEGDNTGYEAVTNLFDGNKLSKWCSYTSGAGSYASRTAQDGKDMVIWKMGSSVVLAGYILTTGNDTQDNPGRNWKSWTIYGGNFADDGTAMIAADGAWTPIHSIVDDTVLQAKSTTDYVFATGNSTAYKYYKLVIDDIVSDSDNIQQMDEFTMLIK